MMDGNRLRIVVFFFNDTATTEIYTLSLHDALPIWTSCSSWSPGPLRTGGSPGRNSRRLSIWSRPGSRRGAAAADRKSTRLNSSHANISYAVFCLKKKNLLLLTSVSHNLYLTFTICL